MPKLPQLAATKLRAIIDAGFYSVGVKMVADEPDQAGSIIVTSRTLVTALKRPCDGQPYRLVYVFEQNNRPDRYAVTDDVVFQGAAILNIEGRHAEKFSGVYWTNRAWHFGVNTAGMITFRRRDKAEPEVVAASGKGGLSETKLKGFANGGHIPSPGACHARESGHPVTRALVQFMRR